MNILARRATVLLTAASLVTAAPGGSAWAQVARVSPAGGKVFAVAVLPGPSAPLSFAPPSLGLSAPALTPPAPLPAPSVALAASPFPVAAQLAAAVPAALTASPAFPAAGRRKLSLPAVAAMDAPAEVQAARASAAFDGAWERLSFDGDAPVEAAPGAGVPPLAPPHRSAPSVAAFAAVMPLAAALPSGAYEWHLFASMAFGAVALIYAITGTVSLLTQPLKSLFDRALPSLPEVLVEPDQFPLSPAKAASALTDEERASLKPGMPLLRAAAGAPQRRWYEFQATDGRTIEVHARTGRRMRSPRSAAFALGQVNRWLAGSRWRAAGPAKLVTTQGEYYRKGELPHYQVDLQGPGGWQVFVSAKDGRILETHSRLSRALKWVGKGPHAWGIKALDKVDTLKRLLSPLLLGVPVVALAVTAFWLKASNGFPLELPGLSDGAWAWHKFFGSWSLFVLLYMGVTGPLTLFMPIATKRLTPKLPKGLSFGPEAFVLSPAEAALALGTETRSVQARSSRRGAWYEFELADGSRRAVSALDGSEVPVFMSASQAEAEAREWLAGTPWTPKPGAVFLDSHDSHYRDFREAEIPVYKLELEGPGGLRVYLSARDGRPTASAMAVRSRLSRFLGTFVKSVHALEWGPFERHPNLRRAAMILLLTMPVALTVILGLIGRFP